jgi:hypothetical protein
MRQHQPKTPKRAVHTANGLADATPPVNVRQGIDAAWIAIARYGRGVSGYVLAVPDTPEPSESLAPRGEPESRFSAGTEETASPGESTGHDRPQGMLPGRERRRSVVERGFVRLIATGGIIGIATILGAVLVSQDVAGWIVGLAVGLTSVILAALLWSSRQL